MLAPAWWPGLALVVGIGLAGEIAVSPVPLLWLMALGASLRRPSGVVVAALATGLLHASLVGPAAGEPSPQIGRPVEALVEPIGPWRAGSWGWSVRVRTVWWRQSGRLQASRCELWLSFAGEERPPQAGRLRVRGRLAALAVHYNDLRPRPRLATLQVKSRRLVAVESPLPPARRLRRWIEERLDLPACPRPGTVRPGRAVLRALLLGDPGCLADTTTRALRRVGLGHLLAVSGLHVGLLALTVTLGTAVLPRWLARSILAVALLGYLVVVGARASLLRALLLLGALACARTMARPGASINALALAAAAIAWLDPRSPSELGFRLSFAATAGILLVAVPWMRGLTRSGRRDEGWRVGPVGRLVLGGAAVTLGAQLFTLPLVAHSFSFLSPSATVLNLLAVPWTALVIAAALPCTLLALSPLCDLSLFDGFLDLLAAPYALTTRLPPSGWLALPLAWRLSPAALTLLLVGLVSVGRRRLALLCLLLCLLVAVLETDAAREPQVVLLDVGQGDALLLRDATGTVLVDGGGAPAADFGGSVLLPALARLGVRRIDLAIVSHGDVDHCGGVADLALRLPVGEVWLPPGLGESRCGQRLSEVAGDRLRVVSRGLERSVGDARYRVLWPPPASRWQGNDASLVVRASLGRVRILLTGDIERAAERRLVASGPVRADLLKVPHHGSRTSTSAELLDAVAPRVALLSAGRHNRYGHPHVETLVRLRRHRVVLWRSDRHGRVVLELPGSRGWRARISAAPGAGR